LPSLVFACRTLGYRGATLGKLFLPLGIFATLMMGIFATHMMGLHLAGLGPSRALGLKISPPSPIPIPFNPQLNKHIISAYKVTKLCNLNQ